MNGDRKALPGEPLPIELMQKEGLGGLQVRFPRQDPRFAGAEELPPLVVVQSAENGRQEIAGSGWWGGRNWNPTDSAAEASPELFQAMARPGDRSYAASRRPAHARRAHWWDVALYARGFWVPLFVAALSFVLALGVTAVELLTAAGAALWIVVALLGLAAVVEAVKAVTAVRDTLRGRPSGAS